jgi:osmotically-inducible protein OsmY
MKNDLQLQADVLEELRWEPSVDAPGIGVAAKDGIVTLTGTVPTYSQSVAAVQVAERVHGVKGVANEINVRLNENGGPDDAALAKAAVEALNWRTTVPDERVKVTVSKGWITLEGDVDWYFQRASSEDAVRHLHGVRGITNRIQITPKATSTEVRSLIESAFRRNAELDAQRVRVETRDGNVVLRGDVRSWAERQQAERSAWAAPGVTQVENHLVVVP